jgi:hypothetical protein
MTLREVPSQPRERLDGIDADIDHHVAYSVGAAFAQLGRASDAVRWLRSAMNDGFRKPPPPDELTVTK